MVNQVWEWLKFQLTSLDISLNSDTDSDILSLNFQRGLRENAILWMIGIYVEMVENEVIVRGNPLKVTTASGIYKQKKLITKHQAIPDLGVIVGLDTQGIG